MTVQKTQELRQFWNELITEKSWQLLQNLKKVKLAK